MPVYEPQVRPRRSIHLRADEECYSLGSACALSFSGMSGMSKRTPAISSCIYMSRTLLQTDPQTKHGCAVGTCNVTLEKFDSHVRDHGRVHYPPLLLSDWSDFEAVMPRASAVACAMAIERCVATMLRSLTKSTAPAIESVDFQ